MITANFEFPADAQVSQGRAGCRTLYPFAELAIGEGFMIEGDALKQASVKSALSRFRRINPTIDIAVATTPAAIYFRREA